MARFNPHPSETREAVLARLRGDPSLSNRSVARSSGIPESTVRTWRRTAGNCPQQTASFDPAALPPKRREAAARLLAVSGVDPRDVATALGGPKSAVPALRRAFGMKRRRLAELRVAAGADAGPHDLAELDASLRAHVGRQIAAFDARLRKGGAGDSGKVLRDLGGLKKLLDDLAARASTDGRGEADGEPEQDLAALRDRVARRCAAILRERPSDGDAGAAGAAALQADRP